jgi:D-alanyl-D-alanine carboxypeptidase
MKKIDSEAAKALMSFGKYKRDNTEVTSSGVVSQMKLYGNLIAIHDDGKLSVSLAGYNTVTTKSRLNGLPGVSICNIKGDPYLNGIKIETDKFYQIQL